MGHHEYKLDPYIYINNIEFKIYIYILPRLIKLINFSILR